MNVDGPGICPVNHLFCGRSHENGPCLVRSLGVTVNVNANANEVETSRTSRCADDIARQRGVVTRDSYGCNHLDRRPVGRRLCETEVEMPGPAIIASAPWRFPAVTGRRRWCPAVISSAAGRILPVLTGWG